MNHLDNIYEKCTDPFKKYLCNITQSKNIYGLIN